jgi:hypothetical protein
LLYISAVILEKGKKRVGKQREEEEREIIQRRGEKG